MIQAAAELVHVLARERWGRPPRAVVIADTGAAMRRIHGEILDLVDPFVDSVKSDQINVMGGASIRFFSGVIRPGRFRGHTIDLLLWFFHPDNELPRVLVEEIEIIMAHRGPLGYEGPRVWRDW